MADNSVFITGAATGAFTEALSDLPPWATEDTAESIERILKKELGIQSKALTTLVKKSSGGNIDTEGLQTELDNLLKSFSEQSAQSKKNRKEEADEHKKRKKRAKEEEERFDRSAFVNNMLISSTLAIKQAFIDNVNTFDKLTEAGINLMTGMDTSNDGFNSLRQLTALTGVRFTELAASMTKYSSAVNSFGVGKFAKTVGMASSNLTRFGFSSKESADLLGSYLSMQQNSADVSLKTAESANKGLQKFANAVFRLSVATGISRTAIIANAEAISKSTDANLLAGQIGTASAQGMTEFLASFKNQNLAAQLLKLMSDPIKPLNETFMNLQKSGMGGFADSLVHFTKSIQGMPAHLQQQALKDFVKANRAEIEQNKQRLALLKQAGVAEAGASLDVLVALTQQADAIQELTPEREKELARLEKSNEASKNLANAWEKLQSLIQRAFAPTATILNTVTTLLNAIIYPLEKLISGIDWLSEKLGALTGTNIDLSSWIGISAIGILLYSKFNLFGTALSTITKAILGSATKISASTMPGKGIGGGAPDLPGTDSKRRRSTGVDRVRDNNKSGILDKISKGIASIGQGIGSAIGGFLEGLATGLKKLGDPKVLLGVVALAGIAASLFITGKAINEFSKSSWEDLAKTGVALVGLMAAMAVVAVAGTALAVPLAIASAAMGLFAGSLWLLGAAINSIGSGLSSLSDGIKKLANTSLADISAITNSVVALGGGIVSFASSLLLATPMLVLASVGLAAFGAVALVAAPGIKWLADGLKVLSSVDGKNLALISSSINTLSDIDFTDLIALGASSKLVGPYLNLFANSINTLGKIDSSKLSQVANSLSTLLGVSSLKLLAFGASAGIAGAGIRVLANSLMTLSTLPQSLSQIFAGLTGNFNAVSSGISNLSNSLNKFDELKTLKDIVNTINSIDTTKAQALISMQSANAVSLPNPSSTANNKLMTTPAPVSINSPSAVTPDLEEKGKQSEPKKVTYASGTGIEKGAADISINTALSYQSSLLEQLLLSTNNIVSVNKDILKYTRSNT